MYQRYSHHICGSGAKERLFAYNALAFGLQSLKMLKDYSFNGESPENPKPVILITTIDTQFLAIFKKRRDPH